MKSLKYILIVALAVISVALTTMWFVLTSLRIENLELRLEQVQLKCEYNEERMRYVVMLNTSRQLHLEQVFENSEGFRLTLDQIKAYNTRMKTHWVSVPRHQQTAIGGE